MATECEWILKDVDEAAFSRLRSEGENPIMARLFAGRGISTRAEASVYCNPVSAALPDPALLPGAEAAADIILDSIRNKEKIVVFGDYDADGVCASAILATGLQKLGADVNVVLPDRLAEGYGLSEKSLRRMMTQYPDTKLVITVDNGITAAAEVDWLKAKGVKVVITDHHLPGDIIPEADALVNPKVSSSPGFDDICGAGVAFFTVNLLVRKAVAAGLYKGGKFGGPLLVLAGIATVADIMPLSGANRTLVARALKYFPEFQPPGLHELFSVDFPRSTDKITERDFGFFIGPRLNAAGRIESAMTAYRLLVSTDREEARELAVKVKGLNAGRKGIEEKAITGVLEKISDDAPAYVVTSKDLHLGVAGIVAARLSDAKNKPVAVAVEDETGVMNGSVRAPDGYNMHDALGEASECLSRFGGHAAAGGFSIKPGMLERFREIFSAACAKQSASADCGRKRFFDAWLNFKDLNIELVDSISLLAPFGECNPQPVFGMHDVQLESVKPIGLDSKHLVLTFSSPRENTQISASSGIKIATTVNEDLPRAVWWNAGAKAEELKRLKRKRFDIFFKIGENTYPSRTDGDERTPPRRLEFFIEDICRV